MASPSRTSRPRTWNEKYHAYLGLIPATAAEGCRQNVHWSFGGIGYFPMYALGNLLAAQLQKAMPDSEAAIRAGDCSGLKSWLTANIHTHGRRYRSQEFCQRATGQALTPQPFVEYLPKNSAGCSACARLPALNKPQ